MVHRPTGKRGLAIPLGGNWYPTSGRAAGVVAAALAVLVVGPRRRVVAPQSLTRITLVYTVALSTPDAVVMMVSVLPSALSA